MLYQAAVILTYPVMLEKNVNSLCAPGHAGPAGTRPWGGTWGGHRRGGGTAEVRAAPQTGTSLTGW